VRYVRARDRVAEELEERYRALLQRWPAVEVAVDWWVRNWSVPVVAEPTYTRADDEAGDLPPLQPWVHQQALLPHLQGGAFAVEDGLLVVRLSGTRTAESGAEERWRRRFEVKLVEAELDWEPPWLAALRRGRPVQAVLVGDDRATLAAVQRFRAQFDDAQSRALWPRGVPGDD